MVDNTGKRADGADKSFTDDVARSGVFNIALLFAMTIIGLALILTPVFDPQTDRKTLAFQPDEMDMIQTGSIPRQDNGKRYTIRRSVLQETPGSVCVVRGSGPGDHCEN